MAARRSLRSFREVERLCKSFPSSAYRRPKVLVFIGFYALLGSQLLSAVVTWDEIILRAAAGLMLGVLVLLGGHTYLWALQKWGGSEDQ